MHEEIKTPESQLLAEEVIRLHDIARNLEKTFGQPGQLSDDIRKCADRLNNLLKRQ